jgi:hypothetical protein
LWEVASIPFVIRRLDFALRVIHPRGIFNRTAVLLYNLPPIALLLVGGFVLVGYVLLVRLGRTTPQDLASGSRVRVHESNPCGGKNIRLAAVATIVFSAGVCFPSVPYLAACAWYGHRDAALRSLEHRAYAALDTGNIAAAKGCLKDIESIDPASHERLSVQGRLAILLGDPSAGVLLKRAVLKDDTLALRALASSLEPVALAKREVIDSAAFAFNCLPDVEQSWIQLLDGFPPVKSNWDADSMDQERHQFLAAFDLELGGDTASAVRHLALAYRQGPKSFWKLPSFWLRWTHRWRQDRLDVIQVRLNRVREGNRGIPGEAALWYAILGHPDKANSILDTLKI